MSSTALVGSDLNKYYREKGKNSSGVPYSICTLCNTEVLRSNYGKNSYLIHMRSKHEVEFKKEQEQKNSQMGASSNNLSRYLSTKTADEEQAERIAVAFSENCWSFNSIDSPSFRNAFGAKIPKGLDRKKLAETVNKVAGKTRKKFLEMNKGKDVFLMMDGGTLNRVRHLNISIAIDQTCFFWRSIRMERMRAVDIEKVLNEVIDELREDQLYVFCLVADNASAMQNVLSKFENTGEGKYLL